MKRSTFDEQKTHDDFVERRRARARAREKQRQTYPQRFWIVGGLAAAHAWMFVLTVLPRSLKPGKQIVNRYETSSTTDVIAHPWAKDDTMPSSLMLLSVVHAPHNPFPETHKNTTLENRTRLNLPDTHVAFSLSYTTHTELNKDRDFAPTKPSSFNGLLCQLSEKRSDTFAPQQMDTLNFLVSPISCTVRTLAGKY